MLDVADLPDDVDALKAMLRDAHVEINRHRGELRGRDLLIEKLKLQLSGLARHRFGTSSEGLEQLQLQIEDLKNSTALAGSPKSPVPHT